jgi:hypothetical protein
MKHEEAKNVAFAQGMVEEWASSAPKQIQDFVKTMIAGYDQLREEIGKQEEQIARQEKQAELQHAMLTQVEALKKDDGNWRDKVSLEFDAKGTCFVYAHVENGESFSVGAAYQDNTLVGLRPTLETTPFSVRITLPYLKAVAKLLEVEGSQIPTTRSGSL